MQELQPRPSTRICGDSDVRAGRGPGQLDWYRYTLRFLAGKSILDVGCGLGDGLRILAEKATVAHGQDLDERLRNQNVIVGPIEEIASKSYDLVICIDVIEHVEDDVAFVRQLGRIARRGLFLTTPNWTASRCHWPYHVREYTPRQFGQLLAPVGRVSLLKGSPSGGEVYPVKHPLLYFYFNDLRTFPLTSFFARCANHMIPSSWRIHSHNAAWVDL